MNNLQHPLQTAAWTCHAPYTKMLSEYRAASDKISARLTVLRQELRNMRAKKAGTYASAQAQTRLEQRIAILLDERNELADVMLSLRVYAQKEAQS